MPSTLSTPSTHNPITSKEFYLTTFLQEYSRLWKLPLKQDKIKYMDASSKLTAKRQIFVDAYIISGNGKQSAIQAGYSRKTADQQASKLLRDNKVKEYLHLLMEKSTSRGNYETRGSPSQSLQYRQSKPQRPRSLELRRGEGNRFIYPR